MATTDLTLALNPEQREAAEHLAGPMLVLAGAGSGKTRVLTTRIALLIERHGVPAERIFAVTFTNRAAGEMKERIRAMLDRDPTGLWIGTFHSLSARLLRREAERIGFSRQFTIYDEDDRLSLIKRIMEQRQHSTKLFPPKLVQSVISAAKNRMQTAADLAASGSDPLTRVAADVFDAMTAALRTQNAMDFDDLMLHPLRLFREHPDVLARYQRRFSFVLVDEFQDTNRAQYELVKLLGVHGNVFVVGDDDQSIYAWRGAEVRNMRDFQRDFAGGSMVRLEENYRSTQIVLDAANAAIAPNTGRIGKTLRTRRRGGEPVTALGAADERDEAEWIVGELVSRRAAGDFTAGQMAVLYRTNAQSRALEEASRRAGLPYRIVGSVSFYERREVKDLLAYLRLLANPADDEAFLRAVAVPRRGIGATSLDLLRAAAATWDKPLLETAAVAERIQGLRPNVREAFHRFGALLDSLRQRVGGAQPVEVLEAVVEAINYEKLLLDEGPEGRDRWDNVRELVAAAAAWSEVVGPEDEGDPAGAVPGRGGAPLLPRRPGRRRGRRDSHDHAHRQGPRVAAGGRGRSRGRTLSALPLARIPRRAGGRAAPLLRGADPGQGQALPDPCSLPAAGRGDLAEPAVAVSGDGAAGARRRAADLLAVRAELVGSGPWRLSSVRALASERRRPRLFPPGARARAPDAGGGAVAGRAPLRQGRAGAAPPLRERHHPGARRGGPGSQGERGVRRRRGGNQTASGGVRRPGAGLGRSMKITTDDVRHVAELAALEVPDADLDRLTRELDGIVAYVGQLTELGSTGERTLFVPGPQAAPLRPDEVRPVPLARGPAELGPDVREGLFVVPRLSGMEGE